MFHTSHSHRLHATMLTESHSVHRGIHFTSLTTLCLFYEGFQRHLNTFLLLSILVLTTSHGLGWVEFAYFVEHKWPETDKDLPRVLKPCLPMSFQVLLERMRPILSHVSGCPGVIWDLISSLLYFQLEGGTDNLPPPQLPET